MKSKHTTAAANTLWGMTAEEHKLNLVERHSAVLVAGGWSAEYEEAYAIVKRVARLLGVKAEELLTEIKQNHKGATGHTELGQPQRPDRSGLNDGAANTTAK